MRALHRWIAASAIGLSASTAGAQTTRESTWIVDANAGVPRVRSSQDFNLVGDLMGGWATPNFGAVVRGAAHTFALDRADTHSDLDAYSGELEGYFRAGSEQIAFELRAEFGASLYDTTFIQVPASGVAFHDQTSVLYRGAVLAGGVADLDERVRLHALLGLGVQDEEYNAVNATSGGSGTSADIADESRISARAEARAEVHWLALPEVASVRLRTEAQFYTLTRSSDVIAIVSGEVSATSSTDTLRQLETSTRLFFHVDALAFLDIAPAAFGGIDTLLVSVSGVSKTDVVPIIGIGLLKYEH